MSVVFPNSNLPTSSQPWGREVQKQLASLIDSSQAESINNAARDNQLNSSIIALTGVVNDISALVAEVSTVANAAAAAAAQAQDAADAAADAASAAASAASTANNAASDANNAINGLLSLGNANSGYTLNVSNITSGGARDGVLTITSGSNTEISLFNGGITLYGPGAGINVGRNGNLGTEVDNGLYVPGVAQAIIGPGGGVYPTNGTSSTGANVIQDGSSGILRRFSSSSRRYKNSEADIWSSEEINPKKLLDIPVKIFKYNDGYLDEGDQNEGKFLPGLMAEDIEQHYPIAAYFKDGLVENWMDRSVLVGCLALIQDLYKKIETLEKGA